MCEIGVAGSGYHKVEALRQDLRPYGIGARWLAIEKDIPEIVHSNPTMVLTDKLYNSAKELQGTLSFLADCGSAPAVFAVFDVLALSMTGIVDGKASFSAASEVMKKPEDCDAEHAIAQHFKSKLDNDHRSEWLFDMYVPGCGIAPVSKRGDAQTDKGKLMWDQSISMGYSRELAESLADVESIRELHRLNCLSDRVVTPKSIVGLRSQYLPADIGKISKVVPGVGMRIIYKKTDAMIASQGDIDRLSDLLSLVEGAMANSTPALAQMIFNEVSRWKM